MHIIHYHIYNIIDVTIHFYRHACYDIYRLAYSTNKMRVSIQLTVRLAGSGENPFSHLTTLFVTAEDTLPTTVMACLYFQHLPIVGKRDARASTLEKFGCLAAPPR